MGVQSGLPLQGRALGGQRHIGHLQRAIRSTRGGNDQGNVVAEKVAVLRGKKGGNITRDIRRKTARRGGVIRQSQQRDVTGQAFLPVGGKPQGGRKIIQRASPVQGQINRRVPRQVQQM